MPRCPQCGNTGHKVKHVTLESLLRAERGADIEDGPYHVCLTPECETVYFGTGDATFVKSDLAVRFGMKEGGPPRPVCYCFDHTVEEIQDEIRRTGQSTVLESIKADMKGSGCRCEYTNPLGGCCLKSVQAVVVNAFRLIGKEEEAPTAGVADHGDCCADNGDTSKRKEVMADCCETPSEPPMGAATSNDCCQTRIAASADGPGSDRAGTLAAGGSVVAANSTIERPP